MQYDRPFTLAPLHPFQSLLRLAFLAVAQRARLFAFDPRARAVTVLRDDAFDFDVRARNDMHRDQLANTPRGGGAGVRGRFDRAYVAANEDGHVARADVLLADQLDIGGLD